MADINLENGFAFTRDDLLNLGIYELRDLGRDVGVCSPTTLKKENLIDAILGVVYGEIPKRKAGKGRGRPTRRMERPSNIFLGLVDRSNSPRCETNILFGKDEEEFCLSAQVASFAKEYLDDEDDGVAIVSEGIVCEEEGSYFVRKYKFVPSETDIKISEEIIKQHNLRDNDVVEYFSSTGKEVTDVLKINGSATGAKIQLKESNIKENYTEQIDNVNFVMNSDNLVFTSKEDLSTFDKIGEKLCSKGYVVVKIHYGKVSSIGKNIFNKGQMEYFVNTIGDEFETMSLTEQAVASIKTLGEKERVVFMIDDASWLLQVIESYPKSIYGTYMHKLLSITKDNSKKLTIIAFAKSLATNRGMLEGIYTNIVEL